MSRLGCSATNCSQNADKTEMIVIIPKHSENPKFTFFHPSEWLWHTFVYFCPEHSLTLDQTLHFQQHVSFICQACYLEFFQSSSLFHCLIPNALKTLIYAFVLSQYSHINYCNSLLAGCHQKLVCKLPKLENNTTTVPASSVVLPG